MAKNSLPFLLFIVFVNVFQTSAQENRYIVYFTDKNNSAFSVGAPNEFLSERAILRREKNLVEITESDLPVNESYIQQIADLGVSVFYASKWLNAVLIQTDQSKVLEIENLTMIEDVELVAPGNLAGSRFATGSRSDRKLTGENRRENSSDATDLQNRMLAVTYMHDLGYRGEGILIGVFDSGFQEVDNLSYFEHLFSDNRIKHSFDFVGNSENVYARDDHGTQVLSCVAAFNEDQIIGTAPGAEFILCITEDVGSEYRIEEFNWIFAAEMADSTGVDIITTSLGYNTFDDPAMDYTITDMDGQTAIISIGAQMAADRGILLVNSAGNLGSDLSWEIITAPADVDNVITVGAITTDSVRSVFSSIGPTADGRIKPDVVALGSGTVVGFNESTNSPEFSSGTSFSTPLVAGLAAGIMQAFPEKNKNEVLQMIRDSGHKSGDSDSELGFGIPSFARARNLVVGIGDELNTEFKLFPNPVENELYLQWDESSQLDGAKIFILNSVGQVIYEDNRQNRRGNEPVKILMGSFAPGLYFLNIVQNGNQQGYKFLKN